MANGKLFAFRAAGQAHVWVLIGNGRAWMQSAQMAGQHQVDLTAEAVVDTASPLWRLPIIGPPPS